MGSRERIQKITLCHSIYGVILNPWWMIQFVWGSSNKLWRVQLPSGTLRFHNIHLWISTRWWQFFLLISSYPSIMKQVQIFWHHFIKILPHIYRIIFMSGRDDEGLLNILSHTNCWLIGSWNSCFLPFPVMWLWVVLLQKRRLSVTLSI